ncbi:MAG: hypothetical protein ACI3XA_01040 [Clostridia bacterium]
MKKCEYEYEPPKAKIYRFDDNDRILTESGIDEETYDYAAFALNRFFGGTNTTIE